VIATKVGFLDGELVDGEFVPSLAPDVILRACDASLERMGIETIDLYYQHKDSDEVPLADSLGAMETLREQGKIRAVGLSNFAADRVDEAVSTARTCGYMPPAALQPWYNLVERERFEGELRDAAIRNGLGVFPYYSLANGFLTGKYRTAADLGKSVRGQRSAAYLETKDAVLRELDAIAAETGAALATVALAWLMAQPAITAPIASATSVEQLRELTAGMELSLTLDQLARLDAASSEAVPA
jgi:aryl-alcohol dehydrogenase-like predicted oxidoreductase